MINTPLASSNPASRIFFSDGRPSTPEACQRMTVRASIECAYLCARLCVTIAFRTDNQDSSKVCNSVKLINPPFASYGTRHSAMSTTEPFFVQLHGRVLGPFSQRELQRMRLEGKIDRASPCRRGANGKWLTVFDVAPMVLRSQLIEEPPQAKPMRMGFLFIAIVCLILAVVVVGMFLFGSFLSSSLPPSPSMHSVGKSAGSPDGFLAPVMTLFALASLIPIFITLLGFSLSLFWIWMLVSALKHEPPGEEKIVWILVIILTGPLGAFIYAFMRYRSCPRAPSS